MRERHKLLRENVTPSAVSHAVASELPTVGSGLVLPGGVSSRACRFPSCMRVLLPTLASVTAIALLVFFCSRAYDRRVAQDLQSRRLASSQDGDTSAEVCGVPHDDDGQQQHNGSHISTLPAGEERRLPVKKRKLPSMGETGTGGGGGSYPPQQERPNYGAVAGPSGLSAPPAAEVPQKNGSSLLPVPSSRSPPQVRTPAELDAVTGLLNLQPHHHGARHFASGTKQNVPVDLQRLWQQSRRMQWQLQRERRERLRLQHSLQRLQKQLHRMWQHQKQQQAHLQQQQHDGEGPYRQGWHQQHWHHLGSQQQDQQQSLVKQDQKKRQPMQQQEQQETQREKRAQQHEQEGHEQQAELELLEDRQQQPLQHADQLSEELLEDEWIVLDSEAPQPGAFQQALQSSAPPGPVRPWTSEQYIMQVTPGYSLVAAAEFVSSTAADASREKAAPPRATAVAGNKVATVESHIAGSSSAASMTLGDSMSLPIVSGLRSPGSTEGAGPATAKTTSAPTTGSALQSLVSTPAVTALLREHDNSPATPKGHPFLHLPKRIVRTTPASYLVDLRRAVTTRPGRRDLVLLLQKAHDLLARQILYFNDIMELRRVAEGLIEHAVNHQFHDVSKQRVGRAVERLGLRFLLMDAVVCTFIVLGQKAEAKYWRMFTRAINHAPPLLPFLGSYVRQPTFAFSLSQELSSAIQTLKKGRRPKAADLLQIKRRLFCMASSPARFKKPDFERWRQDDWSHTGGS
ncbi:hypothetical protein EBH_0039730 [Eimeria brunetti]|uniref:Uncharacterized protein n=1 Tax=Eimeria brunetti TaxID=51314 RepID=U6LRE2_9EIME|nr:hypothetical protein EBH_0039730 [Eimeria brunetti]